MAAFRERRSAASAPRSADGRVICGLSGGVDSAVAAVLIHEAIGDQLTCIFVDHGLLRPARQSRWWARSAVGSIFKLVHGTGRTFLSALEGVRTRK